MVGGSHHDPWPQGQVSQSDVLLRTFFSIILHLCTQVFAYRKLLYFTGFHCFSKTSFEENYSVFLSLLPPCGLEDLCGPQLLSYLKINSGFFPVKPNIFWLKIHFKYELYFAIFNFSLKNAFLVFRRSLQSCTHSWQPYTPQDKLLNYFTKAGRRTLYTNTVWSVIFTLRALFWGCSA